MFDKFIDDVIQDFSEHSTKENIKNPEIRGITYNTKVTINKSIDNIIKYALRQLKSLKGHTSESINKSDTFIFPDIHGRLDLFVQNLFVANLIDPNGNWIGQNKNCIILGDMISRGPYSTETLIYLQALKKQAKEAGSNIEILMGNHEHCIINKVNIDFYNINNTQIIRSIINDCIKNNTIKLSFAENKRNILCVHAGMEKDILKWAIGDINPQTLPLLTGKKSSQEIYKIMDDNDITIEDVSNWMNNIFKKDLRWDAPLLVEDPPPDSPRGVINSRKKICTPDKYAIDSHKLYKTNQFVGHTTTNLPRHCNKGTLFGSIIKINHRFFLDYDLLRGNQSFAAISGNNIYQVHSKVNGLDKTIMPKSQASLIPIHLRYTTGCYHGNTKVLDLSTWDVKLIAKLPEFNKFNSNSKYEPENIDYKILLNKYFHPPFSISNSHDKNTF